MTRKYTFGAVALFCGVVLTIIGSSVAAARPAWHEGDFVGPEGATLDTAGADVKVTMPVQGVGTFEKTGEGSVTFSEFPSVAEVDVRQGAVKLAGQESETYPKLFRRWTFNDTLVDEVVGQTATLKGTAALDANGKTLTVSNSGDKKNTNYVLLGDAVLPSSGAATVEIWFRHNAYKMYSKLFVVGSSADDELVVSVDDYNEGAGMSAAFNRASAGALGLATIGTNYHLSMTVSAPDAEGTTTLTYILTDVDSGTCVRKVTYAAANWSLADLTQTYSTLGWGTSWWGNYDADITVDEFRVWNVALTDDELAASVKAGPDVPFYVALTMAPETSADFTGHAVSVGNFTGAGEVKGGLTVAREAKITETLTVSGDLTLSGPLTVSCGTPIVCSGVLTLDEGFSLRVADFSGPVVIRAEGGIVNKAGELKVRGWTLTQSEKEISLEKNGMMLIFR